MNDQQRREMTIAGGDCWHEIETDKTRRPPFICHKCGVGTFDKDNLNNRTFKTWGDYGWLLERVVKDTESLENFLMKRKGTTFVTLFEWWKAKNPAERNDLICEWHEQRKGE